MKKQKLTEDIKTEIIRELVSGKPQTEVAKSFGYSSSSTICKFMQVAKAKIMDYATTHTTADTLREYAAYGISEKWLAEQGIKCIARKPINEYALVRNYNTGMSLSECMETYSATESEVRDILDKHHIEINEDKIPQLVFGDIVWVKNAKYKNDRDKYENTANRPALIVTPQFLLNRNITAVTVIYGTTHELDVPDWTYFGVNKYYTGKETQYSFCNIDTIRKEDILPPPSDTGKYAHLSPSDYGRLRTKLGYYFGGKNFNAEADCKSAVSDDDIEDFIVKLFENGLDRNTIFDTLKGTVYEANRQSIQSVLDTSGYGGVKSLAQTPEPAPETQAVLTVDEGLDITKEMSKLSMENAELRAMVSVYDKVFERLTK